MQVFDRPTCCKYMLYISWKIKWMKVHDSISQLILSHSWVEHQSCHLYPREVADHQFKKEEESPLFSFCNHCEDMKKFLVHSSTFMISKTKVRRTISGIIGVCRERYYIAKNHKIIPFQSKQHSEIEGNFPLYFPSLISHHLFYRWGNMEMKHIFWDKQRTSSTIRIKHRTENHQTDIKKNIIVHAYLCMHLNY